MDTDKKEILHPLVQWAGQGLLAIGAAAVLPPDLPFPLTASFFFALLLGIDFGKLSMLVRLDKTHITKRIYLKPFGFIATSFRIPVADIQEVTLRQNPDLYFEITAVTMKHDTFVLKTVANKVPAEMELEKIREALQSFIA